MQHNILVIFKFSKLVMAPMENFLHFKLEGSKAGIFEAMQAHHTITHHTIMIHIILSLLKLLIENSVTAI